MRRYIVAAAVLAALLVAVPHPASSQSPDPLLGSWKVNVAKSKYSPGPPPKSQTLKWDRVQGGLLFTVDQVSADGRTTHGETLEKADGSEAPVKGSQPPIARSFKRIDDRTFEDSDKVNGKL